MLRHWQKREPPKSYTSHLLPLLEGGCHRPFWKGLGESRSPRREGASSADPSSHPREKRLGLGPRLLPLGQGRAGPGRAAAAWGPGRRESKAAMWAPLSSPGFKEVQTNSVPVPGGSGSLLGAPACSSLLPSASSLKASSYSS